MRYITTGLVCLFVGVGIGHYALPRVVTKSAVPAWADDRVEMHQRMTVLELQRDLLYVELRDHAPERAAAIADHLGY
jgi:hypothetical protein